MVLCPLRICVCGHVAAAHHWHTLATIETYTKAFGECPCTRVDTCRKQKVLSAPDSAPAADVAVHLFAWTLLAFGAAAPY